MPPVTTCLRVARYATPVVGARLERLAITPRSCRFASNVINRNTIPLSRPQQSCRFLSTSNPLLKKKGRAEREAEEEASSKNSAADFEDPFDFSTLNGSLERNMEKLRADLTKLRTGGKFNPETLEDLRVPLSKESKQTERLGDLAQVVPKGRTLQVMVGEKDHVKPITSTIQASKLNMTPMPDSQNPLLLTIPIPPPTKESRDAALGAAGKAGETAAMGVKNARAASQKRLRGLKLKKAVRPDDLRKAEKEMEKIVEKAGADVKKTVDTAKKGMEQQ